VFFEKGSKVPASGGFKGSGFNVQGFEDSDG
jgi:hypothetical protein